MTRIEKANKIGIILDKLYPETPIPLDGSAANPLLKFENTYLKNLEEVSILFSKKIPAKNGSKNNLIIFSEKPRLCKYSRVGLSFSISSSME